MFQNFIFHWFSHVINFPQNQLTHDAKLQISVAAYDRIWEKLGGEQC